MSCWNGSSLDWIHNNGKRIKDDSGLSPINAIRRTSNFLASAIRWGTTKHLKPHDDQNVKWTESDILNTAALAAKEMENACKAIPDARGWEYDFATGKFRDESGNDLAREKLAAAVRLGDPEESGIGLATLQRAIITQSAIRAFERGISTESILDAPGRGIVPGSVVYSIGREPVYSAMGLNLDRQPGERLAIYQKAKELFDKVAQNRDELEGAKGPESKYARMLQSLGELDAILKVLPPEVRGRVGGYTSLANLGKDTQSGPGVKTIDKFLSRRLEMVGRHLDKYLANEYRIAIERQLVAARPNEW